MDRRILGLGVCLSAVMILASALIGCTDTGAAPEKPPAAPSKVGSPEKEPPKKVSDSAVKVPHEGWKAMSGTSASQCLRGEWTEPDNNRDQTITIKVLSMGGPTLQFPDPPCAKESGQGKLTFKAVGLSGGNWIEVDMLARTGKSGKAVKGPFKHDAKSGTFPSAGRCVLTEAKASCVYGKLKHNDDVANDTSFGYNVYLYDDQGGLLDAKDPGIMTIENP